MKSKKKKNKPNSPIKFIVSNLNILFQEISVYKISKNNNNYLLINLNHQLYNKPRDSNKQRIVGIIKYYKKYNSSIQNHQNYPKQKNPKSALKIIPLILRNISIILRMLEDFYKRITKEKNIGFLRD